MANVLQILQAAKLRNIEVHVEHGELHCDTPPDPEARGVEAELLKRRMAVVHAIRGDGLAARGSSLRPAYPQLPSHQGADFAIQSALWRETQPSGWVKTDIANAVRMLRRIKGSIDMAALKATLSAVADRHNIIRAKVVERVGGLWLSYDDAADPEIEVIDLRGTAPERLDGELYQILCDRLWSPMDVATGGCRVFLIQVGEADNIFGWVLHHLFGDRHAMGVIEAEFDMYYYAFANGVTPPDLCRPLQYVEYCAGVLEWLGSPAANAALSFWRQELAALPPTVVPEDIADDGVRGAGRGIYWPFALSPELCSGLQGLCRSRRLSLSMTLEAAQAIVLWRLTGSESVSLTVVNGGRDEVALELMVGLMARNIPHRFTLNPRQTLADVLFRAQDIFLDVEEFGKLPGFAFYDVLAEVGGSDRAPWFNFVSVAPEGEPDDPQYQRMQLGIPMDGPPPNHLTDNEYGTPHSYGLHVFGSEDSVAGLIAFSTSRYLPETIGRILEGLKLVLGEMVRSPDRRLSDLADKLDLVLGRPG